MPEAVADRIAWPWWKAKKWGMHIAARLFNRYGDPRLTEAGSQERAFAELWAPQCAVQFLDATMQLMARFAQVRGDLAAAPPPMLHAPCSHHKLLAWARAGSPWRQQQTQVLAAQLQLRAVMGMLGLQTLFFLWTMVELHHGNIFMPAGEETGSLGPSQNCLTMPVTAT